MIRDLRDDFKIVSLTKLLYYYTFHYCCLSRRSAHRLYKYIIQEKQYYKTIPSLKQNNIKKIKGEFKGN